MIDSAKIAHTLGLRRAGCAFTGACPACGYSHGFTVEDKNGTTLICCNAGRCSQTEAIAALRGLGLWSGESNPDWAPPPRQSRQPADDAASKTARALTIWRNTAPALGTLVETYFRARRITLPVPPTLRYASWLRHSETGVDFPAIVSAVTVWPSKTPVAVHRTFLTLDGTKKAGVASPKKSLGPIKGGAVRLAAAGPVLIVGEGIESTLSAMQASGLPGWSALSTGGMRCLILPETVREVIIAADHDPIDSRTGKQPGTDAAHAAAERWHDEGRVVRIALPPIAGTDFNDLICEVARCLQKLQKR